MSPTGWISPQKYRRARVLRNLHVDEVSSVDRGAGKGVRVLLTKRASEPVSKVWDGIGELGYRGFTYTDRVEKGHSQMTALEQIAKTIDGRMSGEMSDADVGREHQRMAMNMFPDAPSLGRALNEFYKTAIGQQALCSAQAMRHFEVQKNAAVGDAWEVLRKREGDDGGDGVPHPHKQGHSKAVGEGDQDGVEEPFDRRLKRLTDAGFGKDEAFTMLHRAEKLRRGIG
jgi:hypothetical protein